MRPPGVSKLSVVALRSITNRLLSPLDEYSRLPAPTAPMVPTLMAIDGILFDPRSTVDLVMTGQWSIFGEFDVFQLCKTIATQLWQTLT